MSIHYASISTITNQNLTYKDLKKECVARGMPFKDVVGAGFPELSKWLLVNCMRKPDDQLVYDYDNYIHGLLTERGVEKELLHGSLRLAYVAGEEDEDEKKPKLIPAPKEKKAPREKDSNGLFKGTKKAYVSDLQAKGKTLAQVIEKVTRKFPDAKEKSIKIWFNKFKKTRK